MTQGWWGGFPASSHEVSHRNLSQILDEVIPFVRHFFKKSRVESGHTCHVILINLHLEGSLKHCDASHYRLHVSPHYILALKDSKNPEEASTPLPGSQLHFPPEGSTGVDPPQPFLCIHTGVSTRRNAAFCECVLENIDCWAGGVPYCWASYFRM